MSVVGKASGVSTASGLHSSTEQDSKAGNQTSLKGFEGTHKACSHDSTKQLYEVAAATNELSHNDRVAVCSPCLQMHVSNSMHGGDSQQRAIHPGASSREHDGPVDSTTGVDPCGDAPFGCENHSGASVSGARCYQDATESCPDESGEGVVKLSSFDVSEQERIFRDIQMRKASISHSLRRNHRHAAKRGIAKVKGRSMKGGQMSISSMFTQHALSNKDGVDGKNNIS